MYDDRRDVDHNHLPGGNRAVYAWNARSFGNHVLGYRMQFRHGAYAG